MKKLYTLLAVLLLSVTLYAQVPQKMTYQSIIRDADGYLVTLSNIGVQVSIVKGGPAGVVVFQERHFNQTNINGLLTFHIGEGTTVFGDFDVDWGADDYWIKTEVDLLGGSNWTVEATAQLVTVPYAFHAETANTVKNVDYVEIDAFSVLEADFAEKLQNLELKLDQIEFKKDTVYVFSSDTIYSITRDTVYNYSIDTVYIEESKNGK